MPAPLEQANEENVTDDMLEASCMNDQLCRLFLQEVMQCTRATMVWMQELQSMFNVHMHETAEYLQSEAHLLEERLLEYVDEQVERMLLEIEAELDQQAAPETDTKAFREDGVQDATCVNSPSSKFHVTAMQAILEEHSSKISSAEKAIVSLCDDLRSQQACHESRWKCTEQMFSEILQEISKSGEAGAHVLCGKTPDMNTTSLGEFCTQKRCRFRTRSLSSLSDDDRDNTAVLPTLLSLNSDSMGPDPTTPLWQRVPQPPLFSIFNPDIPARFEEIRRHWVERCKVHEGSLGESLSERSLPSLTPRSHH